MNKMEEKSFVDFIDERIVALSDSNRIGTANNYRRAKSSLMNFLDGEDLKFSQVDSAWVEDYSDWLMKRGMLRNSASFHLRILRAVFNKGVRRGLAKSDNPFSVAYTGIDKTRKRFVDRDVIMKLKELDLSESPKLEMTRNLFLFSLYARGMAFIDIVFLKMENLKGDEIIYRRRKTGQLLRVKVEREMRDIIKEFRKDGGESEYVFGLVKAGEDIPEMYADYERCLSNYNYGLRKLSKMLGLEEPLSSYTARHTWASLAYKWEVPVAVISAGMGHTSETTTRIYLASLDSSLIDAANRRLLDALCIRTPCEL